MTESINSLQYRAPSESVISLFPGALADAYSHGESASLDFDLAIVISVLLLILCGFGVIALFVA
jgi:hypothetical protein